MPIGEFDLIARWFTRPARRSPLGVGDDCALLQPRDGCQLAISCDMLVAGRHFRADVAPQDLGHKALAVNLSDLAACGAQPLGFLLALALPSVDEPFLEGLAQGLWALAERHELDLLGGDTTAGPLNLCVTAIGEVPAGRALLRSGARPGDDLWVSGTLGDARLALEALRGHAALDPGEAEPVRLALDRPEPRIALGRALRATASSAIDLSDGLLGDLGHVLRRSGVGALVEFDALPCSAALRRQPASTRTTCQLAGGDDYELLFTAPGTARDAVQRAAQEAGTAVTRIGRIVAQPGLSVLDGAGREIDLRALRAFDHFASA